MNTIIQQHINSIPDKRVAMLLSKVFNLFLPAGATTDPSPVTSAALSLLAATDTVTRTLYVATRPMVLKAVSASFSTAGGAGAAFTLTKDTGTQAPGAGTAMLTGTVALTGTANTVVSGTLVASAATLTLAAGDRIAALFSGTVTGLAGLNITASLAPA